MLCPATHSTAHHPEHVHPLTRAPFRFAFVPGGVVVFVVKEKMASHNSKHQQLVSGVSILSYWTSSYA